MRVDGGELSVEAEDLSPAEVAMVWAELGEEVRFAVGSGVAPANLLSRGLVLGKLDAEGACEEMGGEGAGQGLGRAEGGEVVCVWL